jgi:hypothetical protein
MDECGPLPTVSMMPTQRRVVTVNASLAHLTLPPQELETCEGPSAPLNARVAVVLNTCGLPLTLPDPRQKCGGISRLGLPAPLRHSWRPAPDRAQPGGEAAAAPDA